PSLARKYAAIFKYCPLPNGLGSDSMSLLYHAGRPITRGILQICGHLRLSADISAVICGYICVYLWIYL
ncbi:MAG: hypothetical protein V1899_00315, partial [Planctomycetota bacterium]